MGPQKYGNTFPVPYMICKSTDQLRFEADFRTRANGPTPKENLMQTLSKE